MIRARAHSIRTSDEVSSLPLRLARLRVLLHRRALWLRHCWRDPTGGMASRASQGAIRDEVVDTLFAMPDAEAERRFQAHDPAAMRRTRAAEALRRRANAVDAATPDQPLALLATRLGVTSAEVDACLLAAAPDLDPAFATLLAYAQDDTARTRPTPAFAATLLGADAQSEASLRRAFGAGGTLRTSLLVELNDTGALTPSLRLLDFLNGDTAVALDAGSLQLASGAALLTDAHAVLAAQLGQWLRARQTPALVNLTGPNGAGRSQIVRAACVNAGLVLIIVRPTARSPMPSPALVRREAQLAAAAVLVAAEEDEEALPWIRALAGCIPLFVATHAPLASGAAGLVDLALPVARPDRRAQFALWKHSLAARQLADDADLRALTMQFDLGPGAIKAASRAATELARLRSPDAPRPVVAAGDLRAACTAQARVALDALAQHIETVADWDDLVLDADTLAQLKALAAQVAQRARVYEDWGFGAKLVRGRGISALFSGVSGVGKTASAEALARALSVELYTVDLAATLSKYIGETPKNLARIFDAAERSGALLFFDEADALFSRRTEIRDSHDRYANVEVSYLLQRMESYAGITVLASNRKNDFDRAFLRRLRFVIDFPFPDLSARRRLWRKVFPTAAQVEPLDLEALAQLELSGGSIRTIALNAAFAAADAGRPVAMADLMAAARREFKKLDRLPATGVPVAVPMSVGADRGVVRTHNRAFV